MSWHARVVRYKTFFIYPDFLFILSQRTSQMFNNFPPQTCPHPKDDLCMISSHAQSYAFKAWPRHESCKYLKSRLTGVQHQSSRVSSCKYTSLLSIMMKFVLLSLVAVAMVSVFLQSLFSRKIESLSHVVLKSYGPLPKDCLGIKCPSMYRG